jgi:hypothetical protein
MDGRQQEQPNEYCCACRQGKVRCLHNDIGNRTAFRHDDLLRLEIDFTITWGSDVRALEE